MLSKGIATDPATGRPFPETEDAKKQIREKREEEVLKDRAAYATMLSSEPGKMLVEIVRGRLINRIKWLVEADPEARAYVGLLVELGVKDSLAGDAVTKLIDRYMRKGE